MLRGAGESSTLLASAMCTRSRKRQATNLVRVEKRHAADESAAGSLRPRTGGITRLNVPLVCRLKGRQGPVEHVLHPTKRSVLVLGRQNKRLGNHVRPAVR